MRELFTIDLKDYDPLAPITKRPSARAIILKKDRIALVYASKKGYYKFPGGGIKNDENPVDALVRETQEESGLVVIRDSVKEFGLVKRWQKSSRNESVFYQENYYYTCSVTGEKVEQNLDDYELEDGFTLKYVSLDEAISTNKKFAEHYEEHGDLFDKVMAEREGRVLEIIGEEFLH